MKTFIRCLMLLVFIGIYFFAVPLSAEHKEKHNRGNSEINDDRHDQDEGPGDDRNDHERHKFGKKKKMKLTHVRAFEVNPKVHPLLSMLLQQPPGLIREDRAGTLVISGNGPSALVDVIIKTIGGLAGVDTVLSKVYTNAGSIVAGAVQVQNLEALIDFPTVVYVKPSVRMELHLNASVPEIKAEQVRNSSKLG